MKFGEKLSIFLKEKSTSQKELAKKLEMSENGISQVVNGRAPTYSFLMKLNNAYPDIDFNDFIKDKPGFNPTLVNEELEEYSNPIRSRIIALKKMIDELDEMTQS